MSIASGSDQDTNVLMLALASDENENGFQQGEGLGIEMIFDINDPAARADVLARLRRVFARFERAKRFKLLENTIRWQDGEPGESILVCKYIALETDKLEDFSKSYFSNESGSSNSTAVNGTR